MYASHYTKPSVKVQFHGCRDTFNSFNVIGGYAIHCVFSLLFGRHFKIWIILVHPICFQFFLRYLLVIIGKRKKVWSKSLCLIQPLVMGFTKITLAFNFAWTWFWQSPRPLSLYPSQNFHSLKLLDENTFSFIYHGLKKLGMTSTYYLPESQWGPYIDP
jgi:hypothetical protein